MYANNLSLARHSRRSALVLIALSSAIAALGFAHRAAAEEYDSNSVIRRISGLSEKLELTTNTSRILTLDKNIPRVQVNNPELLAVTPLSATQVQISAKKAGVTQVNLWDEEGNIHTVDVMIYGDARELSAALQTQFPHASIKVYRYSESLVLSGFVDRPDHVSPIMQLAQDYAPKVINNINVGGVQQILLKVKVMEISRTKLRRLATDFTYLDANGGFFSTGVSGLLNQTSNVPGGFQTIADTSGKAAEFGIVGDNAAFFGFIDWVQQNNIAKILAEPNITAVSGRPAQFNVGGEIPIVVPQSLGTASIEFKPFGTQVDFLPIVLGNGNIRLEVRPRISEIDDSRSVIIQDFVIPALTVRQVDTAVEMKAGQTFALAGLVQERTETLKRGLPYVSDMPVVGVPFRRMEDEVNEIELLIMVTPEFVDPIDPCEAPMGGPGTFTVSPDNRGLYCGGYMEVPAECYPTRGLGACGQDPCACNAGCNGGCNQGFNQGPSQGCNGCANGSQNGIPPQITDGVMLPGGTGFDDGSSPTVAVPPNPIPVDDARTVPVPQQEYPENETIPQPVQNQPADIALPKVEEQQAPAAPAVEAPGADNPPLPPQAVPAEKAAAPDKGAGYFQFPTPQQAYAPAAPMAPAALAPTAPMAPAASGPPIYNGARPYTPPRQPVFLRNASRPHNPNANQAQSAPQSQENSLIGPVGYDVQ